ncbi:MAG: alanine--tRNA ligase [bacterium]
MNSEEIRSRFLKFFEKRGHSVIPSASLVPENDPSVLFTTAGMQQFKPYYLGTKDPIKDFGSKDVVSIQKCVRTSDIDEVGDESHLTFFEMLGNFSFGGYWKKKAIEYAHEFITKEMGLEIDYISIFAGEDGVPEDIESQEIWKSIDPNIKIKKGNRADNFWGPTGEEGPCGPTTEVYVNGLEVWNIVFNEFYQNKDKSLRPLETKGIDTGMGLERLTMVSQNVPTVFDTDLFNFANNPQTRVERIVADHMRAVVTMITDGVIPSNTERGYVLRRLIRRSVANKKEMGEIEKIAEKLTQDEKVLSVLRGETYKFAQTLDVGIKQIEKGTVDPFILFSTYGFPIELTEEIAREKGIKIDKQKFEEDFKKHQEVSKVGAEQKFKGGLADTSEETVRYHTASHLLHQALHGVLGDEVGQRGSNLTSERLRFDFSFPRKLTDEEKQKVEDIVNEKIREKLPVHKVVLPKEEAEKTGARHAFDQKYPDEVSVYYIGPSLADAYSKEFCGGPHVENIGTLGHFKITKEEAVSAGIRRIKAVLE